MSSQTAIAAVARSQQAAMLVAMRSHLKTNSNSLDFATPIETPSRYQEVSAVCNFAIPFYEDEPRLGYSAPYGELAIEIRVAGNDYPETELVMIDWAAHIQDLMLDVQADGLTTTARGFNLTRAFQGISISQEPDIEVKVFDDNLEGSSGLTIGYCKLSYKFDYLLRQF